MLPIYNNCMQQCKKSICTALVRKVKAPCPDQEHRPIPGRVHDLEFVPVHLRPRLGVDLAVDHVRDQQVLTDVQLRSELCVALP